MVYRVQKDKNNPYVMINKESLQNENLSFKAKGILSYFLSLPNDWKIYPSEIEKHSTDGRESLANGIDELIINGYIERDLQHNPIGQFAGYEYVVFETSKGINLAAKEEIELRNSVKKAKKKSKLTNNVTEVIPLAINGFPEYGSPENGIPATTNNNLTNNNNTNNNTTTSNTQSQINTISIPVEVVQVIDVDEIPLSIPISPISSPITESISTLTPTISFVEALGFELELDLPTGSATSPQTLSPELKPVINFIPSTKILSIQQEIEKVIGAEISKTMIQKLITEQGEERINTCLTNWNKFSKVDISNVAAFFISFVKDVIKLPVEQKGTQQANFKNGYAKAPQETNYDQRQYDDEFYKSLYANNDF